MPKTLLFNPKQETVIDEAVNNDQWKVMINFGAKRSGKTFVDNFIFMMELRRVARIAKREGVKTPQYILGGASSKTIKNNILVELYNIFGLQFKFDNSNSFEVSFKDLPPVRVVQAYTNSIAGISGIRGMTSFGAYINEASLANQEVFHEIIDRCSATGARIVCDTNPDIPTHWLKTEYIDKDTDLYISNHFTMDDNPSLDPKYVAAMKQQTGMFYERSVLGNWVTGEGMVYDQFNKDTMVISQDKFEELTANQDLHYYMGVDWGFEHTNVMMLFANDEQGNTYMLKELSQKHVPIVRLVEEAKDMQQQVREWTDVANYTVPIYADSARPDNVNAFTDAGLNCQFAYKQNVLKRVEIVTQLINHHKLFIVAEGADMVVNGFYQYVWNDKTGEPLKQDGDDQMDCLGYGVGSQYLVDHAEPAQTFEQMAESLGELGL